MLLQSRLIGVGTFPGLSTKTVDKPVDKPVRIASVPRLARPEKNRADSGQKDLLFHVDCLAWRLAVLAVEG
jgi:hypothetical protein